MMRRAIFIFVYCLTVLGGVEGQEDGWKMTDRCVKLLLKVVAGRVLDSGDV